MMENGVTTAEPQFIIQWTIGTRNAVVVTMIVKVVKMKVKIFHVYIAALPIIDKITV
jgi:hypothetical protein